MSKLRATDYIPDNVLADVLLKLPVKSLFRFRCVSKSWRDLIDSSYFRERHQPNPHTDTKFIIMAGKKFYTFDHALVGKGKRLRNPPVELQGCVLEFSRSCNGVICLSTNYTGDFVLWNPFTGSTLCSQQLPSPPYEYRKRLTATAFGYDHLNDDYKLVRWDVDVGYDLYRHHHQVCVYSFKQKSWTTITDDRKRESSEYLPRTCTFVNGAMHWPLVEIYDDILNGETCANASILTFDLGTYKFQKIPPPAIPEGSSRSALSVSMWLSNLNGCLCWSHTYTCTPQGKRIVDIWVMKETSWNKIACIDLLNPETRHLCMKAVAYSEKRGKLMLDCGAGKVLVMYDFGTKSLRDVALNPPVEYGYHSFPAFRNLFYCVCVGTWKLCFPPSLTPL